MGLNYTAGMMRANMFLSCDGASVIAKICHTWDKVVDV